MAVTKKRTLVQAAATLLMNLNFPGFPSGQVYAGDLKRLCVPGLNCYACPGALGSCPIGALQSTLNDPAYRFSFYVTGSLAVFGLLLGRLVCGFLCPFGLLQELLYAISAWVRGRVRKYFPEKRPPAASVGLPPVFAALRHVKYVILLLFVILLPLFALDYFGFGSPWFCKYICPSGMVMGALPILTAQEGLRPLLGPTFSLKLLICVGVLVFCLFSHRFFCKYLCPLGAIYGIFNRFSFYTMALDKEKCTSCGRCARSCGMQVNPAARPNSAECIRCGACVRTCPQGALRQGFRIAKNGKNG
ncbi:MAG: 4Fe-4S binding protein [Clostridiales Family XIII bacterium]|jgi:polyferredoxin|nr:4Fe-4S binding protein [Clostridiales Family XIII bacterium]